MHHLHQIRAIARYTLLEALRTRLPLLLTVVLALLLALGFFVSELAIIESQRLRVSFYAAGARFAAVFIVSAHVLGSITREFNDKGIDALLALDLPRPHYILGKLGGFLAIAAAVAAITGLPLLLQAPLPAVLQWGAALALELAVVAAFSLFCVMAFGQFIPAAALVLAFYLLARSLTAIQLISAHPVSGAGKLSHTVGRWMVDGLALVMPALDRWPQTAWLIDAVSPWPSLATWLVQAVLYVAMLAGAAMVDFQRRNF
jgi:ABC-type transport system involved in multi-copper enzyme maturation permease subunit